MTINYFQPEIWAAQLLGTLRSSLVFGGAPCVNRNFEGEISAFGDTVRVTAVADPNIFAYAKDTDLTAPQALADSQQTLTVDQSWAFNFQVDDIDARQIRDGGALMGEAANAAAYGLRDKADKYIGAAMAAGAGNGLGVVDATTVTNVYDALLVPAWVKLEEANVPTEGRFMVISPATYGKLLLDSRFIKVNEAGAATGLRNGVVGQAAGFTIVTSNNVPTRARTTITTTTANGAKTLTSAAGTWSQADIGLAVTGTGVGTSAKIVSVNTAGSVATVDVNSSASATITDAAVVANGIVAIGGTSIAMTYAEQIVKVEAYRPEARFADALKGLHLYGAKILRPSALVTASVKLTA